MSQDWMVRSPRAPELRDLLDAVAAFSAEATVRSDSTETYLVVTEAERPVVWVSPTRPAFGHLEEVRLLPGATAVEEDLPWWTEVTGPEDARSLVADVATAVAAQLGGVADRLSVEPTPEVAP